MSFNWDATNKIPHFTGALSMLGSGLIIFDILRDRKQKLHKPYFRIMLALSIFDFMSSLWFFVGEWARNPNDPALCEASGFFVQLGTTAIPLYNAALSMQYYLSIKHGWSEEVIGKSFEYFAHGFIIALTLALAIIPLPLDLYNPWYFYCYITKSTYDPDTDSYGRGSPLSEDTFHNTAYAIIFLSALIVTTTMACIYARVRKLNKELLNKYDSAAGRSDHNQQDRQWLEQKTTSENNAVLTMALLYTVPFYLTWVVPTSIILRQQLAWAGQTAFQLDFGLRTAFASQIYLAVAVPLQGFFNWFVYMYPRMKERQQGGKADAEKARDTAGATTNLTLSNVANQETQAFDNEVADAGDSTVAIELPPLSGAGQASS